MKIFLIIVTGLLTMIFCGGISRSSTLPTENPSAAKIDASYQKLWAELKIEPGQPAKDEEFLRRAYLDITGRIPTGEQALGFLNSRDPQKRTKLLRKLIDSPEFAEYLHPLSRHCFWGIRAILT
jgi:hypothetical protein